MQEFWRKNCTLKKKKLMSNKLEKEEKIFKIKK
jgi:hypothetical protein